MRPLPLLTALGLLAACSSTPPARPTTYQAELETCRTNAATAIDKQNAKRAYTWALSPLTRSAKIDEATNACMAPKGYATTHPCTDQERRAGNSPNMTVTAAGLSCTTPGRAP